MRFIVLLTITGLKIWYSLRKKHYFDYLFTVSDWKMPSPGKNQTSICFIQHRHYQTGPVLKAFFVNEASSALFQGQFST